MSLTTELDDSGSPTRRFLEERFPNTGKVTGEANAMLRKAETIRPSSSLPWGTLGTAFDYRARYYFHVTPSEELVAWRGALQCVIVPPELATDFFASLDETLARTGPEGQLLEPGDEELLARYCIVLALFEEFERPGATRGLRVVASPWRWPDPNR